MTWVDVCALDELVPERGAGALVEGEQVALFRVADEVFALGNRDPFSGANVMARGIVGSKGDALKVTSPMYKQNFDLRTGRCFDDESVAVPVFSVRVRAGRIEIAAP